MGLLGVSEGLDTHGLAGGQQDDGGVTRLDELGVVLGRLTGTAVNLLLDLSKLASNVSGVAIKDGAVAVGDLSRVVEDNDLGGEVRNTGGGLDDTGLNTTHGDCSNSSDFVNILEGQPEGLVS